MSCLSCLVLRVACYLLPHLNACRRHLVAALGQTFIMWTELQRSGIFEDVAQWHTFLDTLTFFSACWRYCFPGLQLPTAPPDEHLPQLDLILEVLTLVRIALQMPMRSMSRTLHTVGNRYVRKIGFREHLVHLRRHSLSSPTSLSLHKRFRRRLHPDLHRQLRPEMLDDIQAHYFTLYQLGSNTGASFQTMRDLLSVAFLLFPATFHLCQ